MVNPQYPTKAADKGKGKEKDDKDVADENRVCSAIRKLPQVSLDASDDFVAHGRVATRQTRAYGPQRALLPPEALAQLSDVVYGGPELITLPAGIIRRSPRGRSASSTVRTFTARTAKTLSTSPTTTSKRTPSSSTSALRPRPSRMVCPRSCSPTRAPRPSSATP